MSSQPVNTAVTTGLPPGVKSGPLGPRLVAQLIDVVVPVAIALLASAIGNAVGSAGARTVVSLFAALLVAAWLVLVWWMFATRAAGPGMRLMKLQLVGLQDGRPIGYVRFFLRALVLAALSVTVVGLLVMLIFLVRQFRKQGWHDLAADSVVIKERVLAPNRPASRPMVNGQSNSSAAGEDEAHSGRLMAAAGASALAPSVGETRPAPPAVPSAPAGLGSSSGTSDSVRMTRPPSASQPVVKMSSPGSDDDGLPKDQGWFAVLDDGREIGVTGLVLLGRNPQARPGEDDAELIKVADDTRTVSKTHLALGVDGAGLSVMDRGSTNGTTLTDPTGASRPSPAGDVVAVNEGSIVSFGDHWLRIEHRA